MDPIPPWEIEEEEKRGRDESDGYERGLDAEDQDEEEDKDALLVKRIAKVREAFEKNRLKLNAMVQDHESKRPKDVGQARTARPGKTGGTMNMIKALECATFKPNPFTYTDRGEAWMFDIRVKRMSEQRSLVKRLKLKLDTLKEEQRVVRDGKRVFEPPQLAKTDKYGISLLRERVKRSVHRNPLSSSIYGCTCTVRNLR
jgi:hypothetical protein